MKRGKPFQRGQSGNPKGRPPKSRVLTEILEVAGRKKMPVAGGDIIEQRKVVAALLWDVATNGEAILPNGDKLSFAPRDWLEVVKFIYTQIDGPVKAQPPLDTDEVDKVGVLTADALSEAGQQLTEWRKQMNEQLSSQKPPPM